MLKREKIAKRRLFTGKVLSILSVALLVLVSVFLIFQSKQRAEAATSSTLNFQARLLNASGAIVPDGYYNIEFKLYSASSGGSPLWTETWYDSNGVTAGNDNRIQVRSGYVSVYLGNQTAFPGTINWDQEHWITMNVGGVTQTASPTWDGEMNPRLKLTAVPYAFRAGQLAKLTGGNTSTLDFATQTAARSLLLPDENGTLCVQSSSNCGFNTDTSITLQDAYNATSGNTITTTDARNINLTLADTATDSNLLVNIASGSTGRFAVQNNGTDVLGVTSSAVTLSANVSVAGTNTLTVGTGTTTLGGSLLANGDTTIGNATTDRLTVTAQILGASPLVFQGASDNGFTTTFTFTEPTANNTITFPDTSGTVQLAPTSGSYLQQVPTSTAVNTVTPTANSVVGLTVNGTSGTAATAAIFNQAQAADGVNLNLTNSAGTQTNGLAITRNGAGSTTNLFNLTNTSGTVTNAINISGTFTNYINATNLTVTNAGNADFAGTLTAGTGDAFQVSSGGAITAVGANVGSGLLQGTGGITVSGNTTLAATAGNTVGLGNATGAVTITGSSSSSFVLNGATVTATEFNLLDGRDTQLVDTTDAVATAITGTGALNAGSITSGFGSIDTGADNITTTGTVQGTTSVLTQALDRTSSGTLTIGATTATAITLGQSTTISGSSTFTTGTGAVSLQGDTTISAGKNLITAKGTDYSTTGVTADVSIPGSLIRLTGASAQTIDSIAGGVDGRILTIVNAAAQSATLSNNTGATAANRILTGTGAALTLPADAAITLVYDSGASRWRVTGTVTTASGYANTALSNLASTNINTALNTTSGNLSLTTTTSGDITLTPAVGTGLVNVLTGNLKVGNGTPGVTLNGEDAYIEGTLEVDGAVQLDGALVANSTATLNGVATFNTDADFALSGGENVTLAYSGSAPTADFLSLTNTGLSTTTDGVDGLSIDFYQGADGAADTNYGALIALNSSADHASDIGAGLSVVVNNTSTAGSQYGLGLTNLDTATNATTEALLILTNVEGSADKVTDYLKIQSISSTDTTADAIDVSDANLYNAINVGANNIVGTTAVIDLTNFDVASTGAVTVAGGLTSSFDTNAAGTLTIGGSTQNALTIGRVGANTSINGGTINITNNAGTDVTNLLTGNLKVGNGTPDVTLNGEDAYVEGTLEVDGATRLDGALTANSTANIQGHTAIGSGSSVNGFSTYVDALTLVTAHSSALQAYETLTSLGSSTTEYAGTSTGLRLNPNAAPSYYRAYGSETYLEVASGNAENFANLLIGSLSRAVHNGTGTVTALVGSEIAAYKMNTGAVTNLYGLTINGGNLNATNAINSYTGLIVNNPSATGAITSNTGLKVANQTASATTNIGVEIGGASTYALWVGSAANGTTANQGISFGISGDTNVYRSAADTLKTDDAFIASGLITGSAGATIVGNLTVNTSTATDDQILLTAAAGGAARFNGTITNADLTATRTYTLPDSSGTFTLNPTSGAYLQQVPTATATNTITPTANSVVGLTVNGTSGTAATAVSIVQGGTATAATLSQSQNNDGLVITTTNASQTTASALKVTQSGTTTGFTGNLVDITGSSTTGSGNTLNITTVNTTAGNGINVTANALTTGDAVDINHATTALTSGALLRVSSSAADALTTGALTSISSSGNFTTTANTAGLLNVSATASAAGTLVNVANSYASQTTSTLFNVVQSGVTTGYTGNVANFTGSSTTGAANVVNISSANTSAGTALKVTADNLTAGSGLSVATSSTGLTGDLVSIQATGNSGSGLTGNALKVGLTGTTASGSSVALNVTNGNTGSSAYVARFNDDGTYTDSSPVVITGAGYLGVGMTAPLTTLDVAGSTRISGSASSVLTGSIDPTASASVVGVGTAFTTELLVGDRITVSGETRTVISIADNTNLVVDVAFSNNANDTSVDRLPAGLIVRDPSNAYNIAVSSEGNILQQTSLDGTFGMKIKNYSSGSSYAGSSVLLEADTANNVGGLFKLNSAYPSGVVGTLKPNDLGFANISTTGGTVAGNITLYNGNSTGNINFAAGASSKINARIDSGTTRTLTGSIDPTASASVVGVGTKFKTELVAGDRILVTGEVRTVVSITDDTNLTVDYAFSNNANDTSPDRLGSVLGVGGNLTVAASTTDVTYDYQSGIQGVLLVNPASNPSNKTYIGILGEAVSSSSTWANDFSTISGIGGTGIYTGSGTIPNVAGVTTKVNNIGSGTISNAIGVKVDTPINMSTISNNYGMYVFNQSNSVPLGTITNNYGIYLADQTGSASSNDTGIYIGGADNHSLWLGSDAVTEAGGITFGFTGDTVNLYRSNSSTGTLKTDDNFTIGGTTQTFSGASGTVTTSTAGGALTVKTMNYGTGSGTAGAATLQGGNGGTTGGTGGAVNILSGTGTAASTNGGNINITAGAGGSGGATGLVVINTPTFQTATVQNLTAAGPTTISNVNDNSVILLTTNTTGYGAYLGAPTITTDGRIVYITNADTADDISLTAYGISSTINLKPKSTATMIWSTQNGGMWTAAGASSSTDLQAAYTNTAASAGGAEIVLSSTGTGGLTVRNDAATPIIGGLLEVQTSIGSNLFSVNNNATEYATNGGAEGTSFTGWSAAPAGGAVSLYSTPGNNIATGAGSVFANATSTANTGIKNTLNTTLTANLKYKVSYTVRHTSSTSTFTTLDTIYSADGTSTTATCASGKTATYNTWTRVDCTFTATSVGASNAIIIRHSDAVDHDFYVDNFSVTISADVSHAVDGSVDSALGTNWQAYDADGGAGTSGVTRETTTIYDTSGSVAVATTAGSAEGEGVRNNMSITPSVSTQYLVTFYAKSSTAFTDVKVGFLPAGGSSVPAAAQMCNDYNTNTISTTTWTKITCIFTTPSSGISDPDLVIYQGSAAARTFYVDALSITLNTNNSSNVQVGGANKGGPTTLFTLDRSSSAPIADNNDAYLGSMYYDTTTGRIQCYEADGWGACGAAPDNYVNLNPEYSGAVLNGTGVGTMTADFCSNQSGVLQVNYSASTDPCYTSGDVRNYYKWTSPQATQQTYSIYVTYQLPATFRGFASDDTVQLAARADSTSNAAVTYQMYAKTSSGALSQCGTGETTVVTSTNTWQSVGINGNESTGCSLTSSYANGFVIFKINMKANSNASAYVSTLSFTTNGQ